MFCSCGCGSEIRITKLIKWKLKNGQKNFYIKGHYAVTTNHHSWKGGIYINSGGYRFIKSPFHPNARKNGYVAESHLVMSEFLNRPIDTSTEVVHHKNGNKLDNDIKNLVVIKRSKHHLLHPHENQNKPKTCPCCNKKFIAKYNNHRRDKCCSAKCRNQHYKGENANNLKINQKIANEIKQLKGVISSRKIAKLYGISPTHTKRILRGDAW